MVCSNKALLDARPSLADHLKPVVKEGTTIVLFQNGVGAEEPLHEAFPGNTVLSACVSFACEKGRIKLIRLIGMDGRKGSR